VTRNLNFDVGLRWTGSGAEGIGEVSGERQGFVVSAPDSMGGRGVGTNPEELLVSAVVSCYGATLLGVLQRARLPVDSVAVTARGTVAGYPGRARFERLAVSPLILGACTDRLEEYEAAANHAHDRCLIGRALAEDVSYIVESIELRESGAVSLAALDRRGQAPAKSGVEQEVVHALASRS
jgi:peroxiredoxin-like protein